MDYALILKQKYDSGEINSLSQAQKYFNNSNLLKELLTDNNFETIDLLNRLIELHEIPFVLELPKVKKLLKNLADRSFCGDGFSYTGNSDNILSCYNAMISSILIKSNYPDKSKIEKGIEWILKYQNVSRGEENNWNGTSMLKYGGCMKYTPCYVGVVKSVIALSDYNKAPDYPSKIDVSVKLETGLEYILSHNLFLRKSNNKPITSYITKLTYPYFYKTNIVELLKLMKQNGLESDKRCLNAKMLLQSKLKKDGFWRANKLYFPRNWVVFDMPKSPGLWITHEIRKVLA